MDGEHPVQEGAMTDDGERQLRLWRGLALVLAATLAALAFAAYTDPDLLLNFAGLRYCG